MSNYLEGVQKAEELAKELHAKGESNRCVISTLAYMIQGYIEASKFSPSLTPYKICKGMIDYMGSLAGLSKEELAIRLKDNEIKKPT